MCAILLPWWFSLLAAFWNAVPAATSILGPTELVRPGRLAAIFLSISLPLFSSGLFLSVLRLAIIEFEDFLVYELVVFDLRSLDFDSENCEPASH